MFLPSVCVIGKCVLGLIEQQANLNVSYLKLYFGIYTQAGNGYIHYIAFLHKETKYGAY